VLWFTGGGPVEGWFDTRVYDKTKDEQKAQGWTVFVLDTNGNGKRDAYVEPDQPVDPTKDKRMNVGFYAIMPHPKDGSIWGSYRGNPGAVVRVVLGSNPSETAVTEVYNVPAPGFGVRGGDIDKQGVVWVSLASGHLGSFDRRKCKGPLNGPKATGDHCPEGWAFHKYPGPGFEGIGDNSAAPLSDGDRIVDEEQFGPILPVIKYSDPEDALQRANNSPYGLGGSVWGKDAKRATSIAARLESGTAWVNKHLDLAPGIPFGGAKQSGMGVEFSEEGLAEFTQSQVVNVAK